MDFDDVLTQSVAAWRKTKHPRWAQLAEWSAGRLLAQKPERPVVGAGGKKADTEAWNALAERNDPLDFARLAAALPTNRSAVTVERVTTLARRDDPRGVPALLALLEAPPFRARSALDFFRTICATLGATGDVRAREALSDLARRYKAIVETAVGEDVAALCRRTAAEMTVVEATLSAADQATLTALEARFDEERLASSRASSTSRERKQSDDDALAAVYANPDDDGARLVFADLLTERGDVRGEFIGLQIGRAVGRATKADRERERELCVDVKRRAAWALPLSGGAECAFERGFPAVVDLSARGVKTVLGLRAWATVRRARGVDRLSGKMARALLGAPVMQAVREVWGVSQELFDEVDPSRWTGLGAHFFPTRAQLARTPALRELELYVPRTFEANGTPIAFPDDVLDATPQLETLTMSGNWPLTPRFLSSVTRLKALSLQSSMRTAPSDLLRAQTRLERLTVYELPPVELLEGLPLTHLTCTTGLNADTLAGLLEALPTLRSIELRANLRPDALVPLVLAMQGSPLERLTANTLRFVGPSTLEVRGWFEPPTLQELAAKLPPARITHVAHRPYFDDPASGSPRPVAATLEFVAAAFPNAKIELDWS
jgi:uncharacterized protein (TIGR02996 family)